MRNDKDIKETGVSTFWVQNKSIGIKEIEMKIRQNWIAFFAFVAVVSLPLHSRGDIVWNWDIAGAGSGSFTTDGSLTGGLAPAATYTISAFSLTATSTSASLGSSPATWQLGTSSTAVPYTMTWDGSAQTAFTSSDSNAARIEFQNPPTNGVPDYKVVFGLGNKVDDPLIGKIVYATGEEIGALTVTVLVPSSNTVHAVLTNNATPVLSGNVEPAAFLSLGLSFNGVSWAVSNLNSVTLPGFGYDAGTGNWTFDLSTGGLSPAPVALSTEVGYEVAVTGYPQINLGGLSITDTTTNEVTYDVSATISFYEEMEEDGDNWKVTGYSIGIENDRPVMVTLDHGPGYSTSVVTVIDWDYWEAVAPLSAGWPDGTITVSVVSSDLAGNTASNSAAVVLDTFASVSVTQPLFGDNYLLDGEFAGGTLTGTTLGVEPGETVEGTIADKNGLTTAFRTTTDGNGNWSAPLDEFIVETQVELPALADDGDAAPDVATFDDGSFVICWDRVVNSAPSDIWHQRFSSSGAPLSTQVMVNASNSIQDMRASVAVLEDQGYIITWDQNNTIFYRRFNSNGVAVAGDVQVNAGGTTYNLNTDVLALSDGGWMITWRGWADSDYAIFQRRYDSGGSAGSVVEVSHDPDLINDNNPAIAGLADDGWVIAWKKTSIPGDGTDSEIFIQRYDSVGNTNPVGFTMVNASDTRPDYSPAVVGLTNGGWVVTWGKNGGAGDGFDGEIMLQQFNSNGVEVGTNTKVDVADSLGDYLPVITGLPDGGWVIAWRGEGSSDGWDNEIYMQRYNSDGVAGTNVDIRVNASDSGDDQYPEIAAMLDGSWVVVWRDSHDNRVAYRLFDINGRGPGFDSLADGPLDITVTVRDQLGNSGTGTASIVMNLNSLFEPWTVTYGLSDTNAFFNADPDGDGGLNGYEWATGTNPTNPASITMLGISSINTNSVVSFTRNTNATDVAIHLQRSTNLVSNVWNGIATNIVGSWNPPGIVTETGAGNPVDVEITNTHTNHPAAFYRLRVE